MMKMTKFEHACFIVEQDDQSLVVDPGDYTTDLTVPDNVVAIVITHSHQDHLGQDNIAAIAARNPDLVVVGHQDVVGELGEYKTMTVVANEGVKIGAFELEFFGGEHAVIDPSIPVIANLGVMINDAVYYPGDSFTVPDMPVKVLALPVSAPWMKMSEAVAFVRAVKPQIIFPTHDAILSDAGKGLPDMIIPALTKDLGLTYTRLTEPLTV